MSEQKSLTLDEAKAEIQKIVDDALGERYLEDRVIGGSGPQLILEFLARVEQPSEEDMAVLWLIRNGTPVVWVNLKHYQGWCVDTHKTYSDWREITPTEEARKLGWKP